MNAIRQALECPNQDAPMHTSISCVYCSNTADARAELAKLENAMISLFLDPLASHGARALIRQTLGIEHIPFETPEATIARYRDTARDRHTTPLDNFDRDDSKRGTDWGIDWGDGAPIQPTLGEVPDRHTKEQEPNTAHKPTQ